MHALLPEFVTFTGLTYFAHILRRCVCVRLHGERLLSSSTKFFVSNNREWATSAAAAFKCQALVSNELTPEIDKLRKESSSFQEYPRILPVCVVLCWCVGFQGWHGALEGEGCNLLLRNVSSRQDWREGGSFWIFYLTSSVVSRRFGQNYLLKLTDFASLWTIN